jgi:hypothetical protein
LSSSQSRFVLPLSKLAEEEKEEEGGGTSWTTSEKDNEMEVYQALLHIHQFKKDVDSEVENCCFALCTRLRVCVVMTSDEYFFKFGVCVLWHGEERVAK